MIKNRTLILVAVREELCEKDLPNFNIHYTGVVKINESFKTSEVIKEYSPTQIINYGTAGSLNEDFEGISRSDPLRPTGYGRNITRV